MRKFFVLKITIPTRFLFRAGTVLLAILAICAVLEIPFRILLAKGIVRDAPLLMIAGTDFHYVQYDPELGWSNPPGSPSGPKDSGSYASNSLGLRGPEIALKKPEGTFRILTLGDSMIWGWLVKGEETFPYQLESMLNPSPGSGRIEGINAGVTGYGTDQEYLLLKRIGARIAPDLVILFYYANDCLDNNYSYGLYSRGYGAPKPVFLIESGRLVLRNVPVPRILMKDEPKFFVPRAVLLHSALYRVLLTRLQTSWFLGRVFSFTGLVNVEPPWIYAPTHECNDVTTKIIEAVEKECRALGTRLLVVTSPISYDIIDRTTKTSTVDWLDENLRKMGIPSMNLYYEPEFMGRTKEEICLPVHFNSEGYRLMAQAVKRKIIFEQMIPGLR